MIRIDTHVVVWLYSGDTERFGPAILDALETDVLAISPMVELELTFLHELGRLTVTAADIVADLGDRIGLATSAISLTAAVAVATTVPWTRDPFDRLIVADAIAANSELITKDRRIHGHVSLARW